MGCGTVRSLQLCGFIALGFGDTALSLQLFKAVGPVCGLTLVRPGQGAACPGGALCGHVGEQRWVCPSDLAGALRCLNPPPPTLFSTGHFTPY